MRWLFVLSIALVLVLAVYMSYYTRRKSAIPKLIWTYWHDAAKIPKIVQKCIDTWQANNPEYKLVILDSGKVKRMFGELRMMFPNMSAQDLNREQSHARTSDYARVLVLSQYGGTWMDSSIICTRSLDWAHKIQRKTQAELIGFYAPHTTNKRFPILENWFFSCVPNSTFMQDWLAEIRFMSSFKKEQEYVGYIKGMKGIDMQDLDGSLPYLVMHLCATVVQQRSPWKYRLHLTEGTKGPFKYLEDNGWELPRSFEELCKRRELQTPIIKMRGTERKFLEANGVRCESENPHVRYVLSSEEPRS